ncbi:MAG: hypothetical protein M3Q34_04665 [bacterium]|nr:hypothetical protein [bacterium]
MDTTTIMVTVVTADATVLGGITTGVTVTTVAMVVTMGMVDTKPKPIQVYAAMVLSSTRATPGQMVGPVG